MPAFSGKAFPEREYFYQNFRDKYTALIQGDWKLVNSKELYNLKDARIESRDLSQSAPEQLQRMQAEFSRLDAELNSGDKRRK